MHCPKCSNEMTWGSDGWYCEYCGWFVAACPLCGRPVRVITSDEGTSWYEPILTTMDDIHSGGE